MFLTIWVGVVHSYSVSRAVAIAVIPFQNLQSLGMLGDLYQDTTVGLLSQLAKFNRGHNYQESSIYPYIPGIPEKKTE